MTETHLNSLKPYLATDARLIPLRNWRSTKNTAKGVMKLGKLPLEKGWHEKDYSHEAMVEHMSDGNNVGFRVGDGWGIIDFDPRNDLDVDGEVKPRERWSVWKLLADFDIRQGDYAYTETGGGGIHIYLRIPVGYHGRETLPDIYGKGVEFKTSGRKYVVAAGSVHPGKQDEGLTPRPYMWGASSRALTQTRTAPDALLEAFAHSRPPTEMLGTGDETFGRYSGAELERILSVLDPIDFGKHSSKDDPIYDWVGLMFACHWFTGGEGREEFIDWCLQDPAYSNDAYSIAARWDSCSGRHDGVKSGRLFKLLDMHNADESSYPREKTSEVFDPPHIDELDIEQNPSSTEAQILQEMNRRHAFVLLKGKGVIMRDDWDFKNANSTTKTFCFERDIKGLYANTAFATLDKTGKTVEKTWFEHWWTHPDRRQYMGVDFVPDETPEFMTPAGLFYNGWQGWPFKLEDGRGPGDWDLLKQHILECICAGDEELYDYLMKWMAYSLQRARGPQKVAFVIRGPKGVGKNLFADAWQDCFGLHGVQTDDDNIVFGRFNERMSTTMGLVLNEAFWAGDRSRVGKIKHRINGQTIQVENKYTPSREVRNNLKIMMLTNEGWAVPAEEDERRFVVTDAVRARPKNDPFYRQVARQLRGANNEHTHGIRAMFYDLMHMDIGSFDPEVNIIKTNALGDQVRQTFGDVGQWWHDTLKADTLPYKFDPDPKYRKEDGPLSNWDARPVAIPMAAIRDNLYDYLNGKPQGELSHNFKQRYVNSVLRLFPPNTLSRKRLKLPDSESFSSIDTNAKGACDCFVLPPRQECIDFLNDMFGISEEDDYESFDASEMGMEDESEMFV